MYIVTITPDLRMSIDPHHGPVTLDDLRPRITEDRFDHTTVDAIDLTVASGERYATMWVDDEGLLKTLPHNMAATILALDSHAGAPIVGTAVITGPPDEDGEVWPCGPLAVARVLDILHRAVATKYPESVRESVA